MKKKKVIGCLLAAALVTTGLPQNVWAQQNQAQLSKQETTSVEKESMSIFENMKNGKKQQEQKEDEIVTVIVEVKADSMVKQFEKSSHSDFQTFLETNKEKRVAIQEQVNSVKKSIENLDQKTSQKPEVLYTYDTVFSGLSVKVPFSELAKIKKLPNVKNAFVASTYQVPEEPEKKGSDVRTSMVSSRNMIATDKVQNQEDLNYTGKGETVAVIDTGLNYKHEAFAETPPQQHYTAEDIQNLLDTCDLASERDFEEGTIQAQTGEDATSVFKSDKVPYAYDYIDHDTDAIPLDTNNHGTHVSGTIAGNSEKLQGIAPDAQLLALKVFDDNGRTTDAVLLAALQDAVLLQSDAINMSLGSSAGFTTSSETAMQDVYDSIKKAGICLDVSAGNASTSGKSSQFGDDALAENIDNGIVSDPSSLNAALSVASIENTMINQVLFIADSEGNKYGYTDNAEKESQFSTLGKGEFPYEVCGFGTADDFAGKQLDGKIALVQRGGLTFSDKVKNAAEAGAKAVVVYNNTVGTVSMSVTNYYVPAIAITKSAGETLVRLAKEGKGTLYFDPDETTSIENEEAGHMSTFSSWGTTPDLKIKPEITAPGGNITSAYYVNEDGSSAYGIMSGTSMAAPHLSGASAVLRQYIKENKPEYFDYTGEELQNYVNTLFMSTAVPVEDEETEQALGGQTIYYPVRQQGAGMVNLEAAVKTNAYMTVKGSDRPKAELGYNEKGLYSFTAEIVNDGEKDLTYDLDAAVQVPDSYSAYGKNFIAQNDLSIADAGAVVTYAGDMVNGQTVTVLAGQTAEVSVQIQLDLSSDMIKEESEIFKNGFYVEGFLFANSKDEQTPDLSIPYLGFYGDWGKATMFDASIYDKDATPVFDASSIKTKPIYLGDSLTGSATQIILGQNPLAVLSSHGDMTPDKDHMILSPESYYVNDAIPSTTLLRGVDELEYKVTDKRKKAVKELTYPLVSKSFYSTSGGLYHAEDVAWDESEIHFDGIGSTGNALADGDYAFTITGTKAGVKEGTSKTETINYTITVDKESPALEKVEAYEKNGTVYVDVAATDNRGLSGFEVDMQNKWGAIAPVYAYTYCEKKDEQTLAIGKAAELEKQGYSLDSLTVVAYDYAMNYDYTFAAVDVTDQSADQTKDQQTSEIPSIEPSHASDNPSTEPSHASEAPSENAEPEKPEVKGIRLVDQKMALTVGEERNIIPYALPQGVLLEDAVYESSDEEVASVSETGTVLAKKAGTATITVYTADKKVKQTFEVTVRELPKAEPVLPTQPTQPSEPEVTGIQLSDEEVHMGVGDVKNLKAYEVPTGKVAANAKFSSDQTDVAEVTEDGKVTAKKAGTATIHMQTQDGAFTAECKVVVVDLESKKEAEDTDIILYNEKMNIAVGDVRDLIVFAKPSGKIVEDAVYTSSDETVVKVSEKGKITAVGAGSAMITVTTKDGKCQSVCSIEVTQIKGDVETPGSTEPSTAPSESEPSATPSESAPSTQETQTPDQAPSIEETPSTPSGSDADSKTPVKAPGTAQIKKVTSKKDGSISIQFAGVPDADGYSIYRGTEKNGKYVLVATTEKTSVIDQKNIVFGKTYYYRVKAYAKDEKEKVYAKASKAVSVKSVNFGTLKLTDAKRVSSKKIKLTWKQMPGAKGYEVYRSTSRNGKYTKIKEIKSAKCTAYTNSVSKNKTYYYKVRPVGKNGKTVVKGSFSAVKAALPTKK
ncbi:MAG: S8 family serine peptidase [Lachnospiraceae bacterium]